jgi:hypothetical protein
VNTDHPARSRSFSAAHQALIAEVEEVGGPVVPRSVRLGGNEVGAAFLSGYLHAQGSVRVSPTVEVTFTHGSATFLESIRSLMANLGVQADLWCGPGSLPCILEVSDAYAVSVLATELRPSGPGRATLAHTVSVPVRSAPRDHDLVRVVEVTYVPVAVPTIALEVEEHHNHVTNGIITHNTNRTGLHSDVAAQLSAIAHAETVTTDNETLQPMIQVDAGVAIHLSKEGYQVKPVSLGGQVWDYFGALREAWDFHVLDGLLRDKEKALGKSMSGPELLVPTDWASK